MQRQVIVPGSGRPWHHDDGVDHGAPLVFSVAAVWTPGECADMVARIEELGPADAPITTATGFVMRPDIRNNTRVMFDDHAVAAALFARIREAVPVRLHGRRPVGVNERFRGYRYERGQRFAPHYDGAYRRSATECSALTLMVYLNDGFTGGETTFLHFDTTVVPQTGVALMFQHPLLHAGCEVASGVKYVLRSDVMYAA